VFHSSSLIACADNTHVADWCIALILVCASCSPLVLFLSSETSFERVVDHCIVVWKIEFSNFNRPLVRRYGGFNG